MNLELDHLVKICPDTDSQRLSLFVAPLNDTFSRYAINNKERIASFLAQAAHESLQFKVLVENLRYSKPERIAAIFRKDFDLNHDRITDPEEIAFAAQFVNQPEKLANYAYANQNGNEDEASGDGWKYRGRGIFQVTGRDNYGHCSLAIMGDPGILLAEPEKLEQPDLACRSAGWFWQSNGLNKLADQGRFQDITKRINGGTHGLKERTAFYYLALEVLS